MTGCAAGPALISSVITGLAIFDYDDYEYKLWHTTLIMWALILFPFIFNLWFSRFIFAFELISGAMHFIFFIATIITLSVLAERSTPQFVFKNFTQGLSGWENPGVTWGLGLLTVTYAVNGFDGILHMSTRSQLPYA